jgi:acetyltransferase-like isoleucine patch superfamily enzyme
MKKPIIFIGARNIINDMAITADFAGHEVLGILDSRFQDSVEGIPVIGQEQWLLDDSHAEAQQWLRTCVFIVGSYWDGGQHLGRNHHPGLVRQQHIHIAEQSGAQLVNLTHPDAMIDFDHRYSNAEIGHGCFFNRGSLSVSSGVTIGNHFVAEAGSIIGDGTRLGNNVILAPGTFLYQCNVGNNVYFGAWSKVNIWHKKAPIDIGDDVTVFTNAEVTKDIPNSHMYTADGRVLRKTKV